MPRKANKKTVAGKKSSAEKSPTFESKPRNAVAVKPQAGIPRQAASSNETGTSDLGRVGRAFSAIRGLFRRAKPAVADAAPIVETSVERAGGHTQERTVRRESDIPRDVLNNTYTPRLTSSKMGFRATGADHQHDQEFAAGVADERWNDEDRLTNKSGDPRIGTRGRTYEPGETREESRSNE